MVIVILLVFLCGSNTFADRLKLYLKKADFRSENPLATVGVAPVSLGFRD